MNNQNAKADKGKTETFPFVEGISSVKLTEDGMKVDVQTWLDFLNEVVEV